jgi:hypothetical protein
MLVGLAQPPTTHIGTPALLMSANGVPQAAQILMGPGSAIIGMHPGRVFCGGLGTKVDEDTLRTFMSTFGQVLDAKIIVDRETGISKG